MVLTRGQKRKASQTDFHHNLGFSQENPISPSPRIKRAARVKAEILISGKRQEKLHDIKKTEKRKIPKIPDAVWAGDATLVDDILQKRKKVVKSTLNRPLHIAVGKNDIETVKVLLTHGADANHKTILNHVVEQHNIELIDLLLQFGANPNTPDPKNSGASTAHVLIDYPESNLQEFTSVLDKLLSHGLDLHLKNDHGRSAIFGACGKLKPRMLDILIEKGANVNDQAVNNMLRTKKRYDSVLCARYAENSSLPTPLHQSLQIWEDGHNKITPFDMVKKLLSHGACVHMRDSMGYTPLMRCLKHQGNKIGIAKYLLEVGSDPNEIALDGSSPLILAIMYAREFVQVLLDAGAHGNTVYKDYNQNCTPLQCAIKNKYDQAIIDAIIDRTDVYHLNHKGYNLQETALAMAVQKKWDPAFIAKMIQRGCDPNISNLADITPLGYAVQSSDNLSMVRQLLLLGAVGNRDELHSPGSDREATVLASTAGNNTVVRMLLSAGCHIGGPTKRGIGKLNTDVQETLKAHLNTPIKLQDICRMSIWRTTGALENNGHKLHLPKALHSYLILEDFFHDTLF